jgi:N-acetylneuraminic acid mutarotase
VPAGTYVLGAIADTTLIGAGFTDTGSVGNTWWATSTTGVPLARFSHTAVWTGSRMIVWGGQDPTSPGYCSTGGQYDPVTDAWSATTTTGAPSARESHTAIWTGSRMIVWGGGTSDAGGRYDPDDDTWSATSLTGAPSARSSHTAVWTGSRMIVWGGYGSSSVGYSLVNVNTGGEYDPATDTWSATTTTGAPSARNYHTAIWTGSRMIVWGGLGLDSGGYSYVWFNTGSQYLELHFYRRN